MKKKNVEKKTLNLDDWEIVDNEDEKKEVKKIEKKEVKKNIKNQNKKEVKPQMKKEIKTQGKTQMKKEEKKEVIKEDKKEEKKEEKKGETEKKTIFDEFLLDADWDTKDETDYKNNVLNQNWLKKSEYLDVDKFSQNISSFHYFDRHCSCLLGNYEKNFGGILSRPGFSSDPSSKKLCRRGVPLNYMRDVLLKLFDIEKVNENNYNKLYEMIFKEHDVNNLGDYVPYFSGKKTLKESLPFHYLNEKGVIELKTLLWMINEAHRNVIIYCPIFIKILSLVLIFCNKYETLELICKIIEKEKSTEDTLDIKKRFFFTQSDNNILIDSFESCISEIAHKKRDSFYDLLKKVKFNKKDLYKDMYTDFFFNYFNFYGMVRLLPLFLRDGIKSIYRIICSMENEILEKGIQLKGKNCDVLKEIREKTKKMDVNEIINNSFNYELKINKKEEDQEGITNENNEFYLPIYKGGDLLSDYEIIHLWELFPTEYKIKNAEIIYQASKDGYNLPNIIDLELKYNKNTCILFLIGTTTGEKFGFINSNLIVHTDNEYQRPTSTLLVTIRPEFNIYTPRSDSDEILYVSNKDFIFGNGKIGPAIHLNQDLMKGNSYKGGCFNNPSLVKNPEGHFTVSKLEIFKLD